MTKTMRPTWVVVADGASAQFYALTEGADGRSIEPAEKAMSAGLHRHASDLKSDRPGRSFEGSGTGVRHAIEPHHDYHKLEKHDFTHSVAAVLEHAFDAHKFERLAVVAPARSLGELRSELPDKVKKVIWREVSKDFTKLGRQDLWARIAPHLEETARPSTA